MAGRRCPAPRCPVILTQGERYCSQHASENAKRRGSTAKRGYGSAHQRLRARWQARIDRSNVPCATCGTRLAGTDWQLGHNHVRGGYLGPQCTRCNASDGGRRGAVIGNQRRTES